MPRRTVSLDVKVKAMRECLRLAEVEDVTRKYELSDQSLYNWFGRILASLPELLADKKPGRKPNSAAEQPPPF